MPAIIANILRPVIIWVVQQGATLAVFAVLEKVLDHLQEWVRDGLNISEDDSRAIVANYAVDAIAYVGAGAAIIYSKAPITLAKKIGLGNRTATKAKVSTEAVAKVAVITPEIVSKTGTSLFKKLALTAGGISGLIWLLNVVPQTIEPGIYQPRQANDVWEKFIGIRPFSEPSPLESPGPFTRGEFDDYSRGVETGGILGLEYPLGSYMYTKDNLARLIDWVTGQEAGKGKTLTAKSIVPLLAQYLIMTKKTGTTTTTPVKSTTTSTAITVPKIQVFTGVLSQGVLGVGLEFQARPDDMIESAQELVDAASNNLAPFLSALASRVTYQVKIVSSITTKDGFVQKGSVRQVISSYDTKGNPKYKTVVNKFATLDINVLTDKGTRVKIATIVLGPVDSVKFQVGQQTISNVDSTLRGLVTTSDINDIKGVSTVNPITITTPPQQTQTQAQVVTQPQVGTTMPLPTQATGKPEGFRASFTTPSGMQIYTANDGQLYDANGSKLYQDPKSPNNYSTTPFAAPVVQTTAKPGANASTLFEWYQANGWDVPTVQIRSVLYQNLGLGQSAYYTGTSEQNTKLLTKLKSQ